MPEKILMKGNEAIAEAAIRAGCRNYYGYPITPQSEISEYLAWRMFEAGGVFLQAESEIAAISMVFGAAACGARAMTSSSGPGLCLKQETISHMCATQIPCLIVNVARGGPGLGSIQGAQSDYFQSTRGGGNGDYFVLVYAPNSVQEMADCTVLAFDRGDKYRIPAMLLSDGFIGQMMEPVVLPEQLPDPPEKPWAASGYGGEGKPRVHESFFLDPRDCEAHNRRLQEKYDLITEKETRWEETDTQTADIVLVAYGLCSRICLTAMKQAGGEGLRVGLLRPITLWPFPAAPIGALAARGKRFLVVEQSLGQMVQDVRLAVNGRTEVAFYGRPGGVVPAVRDILAELRAMARGTKQ